jgi:hypothetical protein
VRFRADDKVGTREDQEFLVKEVIEQQGLLIYAGENQRLPEAQLRTRGKAAQHFRSGVSGRQKPAPDS